MINLNNILHFGEDSAIVTALNRSLAVIEFALDGSILTANSNFLTLMGYALDEVRGQNHRMFVDKDEASSPAYAQFWSNLRAGKFQSAEYMRLGKGGGEIWIQATYNPILDRHGQPVKVIKFATDISQQKLRLADYHGQIAAIGKAQAVIEFALDGTILDANDNFLTTIGYQLNEIRGQHHRIFVEPEYARSAEYRVFWSKLQNGQFHADEYCRLGKGGKKVWIQASYNPILDPRGRPFKVVKYATDITRQVQRRQDAEKSSADIDANLACIVSTVGGIQLQTTNVAGATTQTSASVQTVAASAEEMTHSISEVSSNVFHSKESADSALDQIILAEGNAARLSTAAGSMSSVIEFIQHIASNINLLALNATIESARAGDAGRGFAVVASEVKTLAKQVADATQNISQEIVGVQNISTNVAAALVQIRSAMQEVQGSVTGVAGAIEQQTQVTREISSNMQGTAGAVCNIEDGMHGIEIGIHDILVAVEAAKTLSAATQRLYAEL
ncbi:MAG: methyl-accepting chemotaxis protein [Elstera sp.]|jgi:methyl-accepting chemotaxis protein